MKKLLFVAFAAVSCSVFAGSTCTWKGDAGGNGSMSVAGNWVDGAAPTTGDKIVIPESASERTIENDLDETIEIDSVVIEGVNQGKINLTGSKTLTLTSTSAWMSTNALEVAFPIRIKMASHGTCNFLACCGNKLTANFRGAITMENGSSTFRPTITSTVGSYTVGAVHYYGPITTPANSDVGVIMPSSDAQMHFQARSRRAICALPVGIRAGCISTARKANIRTSISRGPSSSLPRQRM